MRIYVINYEHFIDFVKFSYIITRFPHKFSYTQKNGVVRIWQKCQNLLTQKCQPCHSVNNSWHILSRKISSILFDKNVKISWQKVSKYFDKKCPNILTKSVQIFWHKMSNVYIYNKIIKLTSRLRFYLIRFRSSSIQTYLILQSPCEHRQQKIQSASKNAARP